MAYATVAQLKKHLGIETANTQDDTYLGELLDEARDFIESKEGTGRQFEVSGDTTRYFDAVRDVRGRLLFLHADLCTITTITNGGGAYLVTNTQYVTEPRNTAPYWGIRLKGSVLPNWTYSGSPEDAIAITGCWGYSTSAPARVRRLHRGIAAWAYRQKEGNQDLDRPLVTPGGHTLLPSRLPHHLMSEIIALRRPGL